MSWLFVGLGAFLTLLVCSELALAEVQTPTYRDTRSHTHADYSPWSNSVIHRVEEKILQAIQQDRRELPAGTQAPAMIALVPGTLWISEVASGASVVPPSPSPMAAVPPAATADSASPPLATPTFESSSPVLPPSAPPPASPPQTAQALPTSTVPLVPSATFVAPKGFPDTYSPAGEATDYFLCDLTGAQTGGLCQGGTRGKSRSSTGLTPYNFYSGSLPGCTIRGGVSGHIYLYAANSASTPAPIDIMVYAGSGSWSPLGGYTLSVPGETFSPALVEGAFAVLAYDFGVSEMIRLEIIAGPGATFYWDGDFSESRITIP